MKKGLCLLLTVFLTLCVAGCGGETKSNETSGSEVFSERNSQLTKAETLDEILEAIDAEGKSYVDSIKKQYSVVTETIGDSYERYKDNYKLITDWYAFIESEGSSFYKKMDSYYESYYRKMFEMYKDDDEGLDKSLDDFYDKVYSGTFDDLYDDIYSGALDDAYDDYYSGLLDDAYDSVEYKEWSNATSLFYKDWSNATSAFYKMWSKGSSRFYTIWSIMSGSVYNGNRDYDALMAKAEANLSEKAEDKPAEVDTQAPKETSTSAATSTTERNKAEETRRKDDASSSQSSSGNIRPEFQKAMDEYLAFFEEYTEFIKEYSESDDPTSLLGQYTSYMKQYSDTMAAFEKMGDEEMNSAETKLYIDTNATIQKMLLDAM